ncbi:MAG TPA: hypothetical protein VFR91_06220 [Dyella sp.]|nr:hypothetical protein [Dyella sp.]
MNRLTDPAWLAATYRLPLPLTRTLVRDHALRQWRRLWPLALLTGVLLLIELSVCAGIVTAVPFVQGALWPAVLIVMALHLWLAQRAARTSILDEVKRLAHQRTVRDAR